MKFINYSKAPELKRFANGYANLCHNCVAAHNEIPLPTDLVVRKHGSASEASCENCGQLREAQNMSTYRVWHLTHGEVW